ncbi:hypothetical protein PIB30_102180 [Stylosanthes scabra]|uniref:Uncharacterized protein n=1 Tax=Stylosanthes scabra TaxID=79078 RepID=A0ABU6UYE4_9FABA|nr:hypothetical protein [Stylosanthes scabra]
MDRSEYGPCPISDDWGSMIPLWSWVVQAQYPEQLPRTREVRRSGLCELLRLPRGLCRLVVWLRCEKLLLEVSENEGFSLLCFFFRKVSLSSASFAFFPFSRVPAVAHPSVFLGGEMAENSQGDRAAAAVQISRELPSIYRWVTNDVLGTPSSLDQQYLSPGFCSAEAIRSADIR